MIGRNKIMIRLVMTYEREIILFEIQNKIIVYKDRKWPKGFQFMPKDDKIIKAIILSRNRIRKEMINWINEANSGKNLEQYNNTDSDEELADITKKDAELRGCVFRKKQYLIFNDLGKEEEVFPEKQNEN